MQRFTAQGPGTVRVPASGPNAPGYVDSTILDSNGNPYRRPIDPLGDANKSYAASVFRDLPINALELDWQISDIRNALGEHVLGQFQASARLIDSMMGNDRVQSALGSRADALLGLGEKYRRAKADTDRECLAAWKECWPKCHAPADQGDVLDEIMRVRLMGGLHVSEITWDTDVFPWQPYLKPWNLQHVYLDQSRRQLIALSEDGPIPITPGDGRWFVHAPFGIYRGYLQGLVRALALPWLLHNLARRDWARYSERHGLPIIKAKVPAVAKTDDKKRFENDLVSMGTEAVAVLPQGLDGNGFDIELLEASAQSWEGFDRLIMRCESAITIAVQWQNLTTEVKEGSEAAARVHADVKQAAVMFDDRALGIDIDRQIARPFALWNFGDAAKAPTTRRDTTVLDDKAAQMQALLSFAQACQALVTAGVTFNVPTLAKAHRVKGLAKAKLVAKAVTDGAPPEQAVKEAA